MLQTKELIFPLTEPDDPYMKDSNCLSDMIEKFLKEQGDKIKVIDIKYNFSILSRMEMSTIDPTQGRSMDLPVSCALIIYEDVK